MRAAIKKLMPLVQLTKATPRFSLVTVAAKNSMKLKQFKTQIFLNHTSKATFAVKTVNVPSMGDSITEGEVHQMLKQVGDYVELDEVVCSVETDKTQVPIRSPEAGVITELFAKEGEAVQVGKPFFVLDTDAKKPEGAAKPAAAKEAKKEDAPKKADSPKVDAPKTEAAKPAAGAPKKTDAPKTSSTQMNIQWGEKSRSEKREPLSRMRQRIGERLKDSQNTYALLTTFQEVDMGAAMELRNKF